MKTNKSGIRVIVKRSAEKLQQTLTRYDRKYGGFEFLGYKPFPVIVGDTSRTYWTAVIRLPNKVIKTMPLLGEKEVIIESEAITNDAIGEATTEPMTEAEKLIAGL